MASAVSYRLTSALGLYFPRFGIRCKNLQFPLLRDLTNGAQSSVNGEEGNFECSNRKKDISYLKKEEWEYRNCKSKNESNSFPLVVDFDDMSAIMTLARKKIYPIVTHPLIVYPEKDFCRIESILNVFLDGKKEFVGMDVEIYEEENKLISSTLQIALSDSVVLVVILENLLTELNSPLKNLKDAIPSLYKLLKEKDVRKVGVGITGDCNKLQKDLHIEGIIAGTEINRLISSNNNNPKSLQTLALEVLNVWVDKDTKNMGWNMGESIPIRSLLYAAMDAQVSYLLYKKLKGGSNNGVVNPHEAGSRTCTQAFGRLKYEVEAKFDLRSRYSNRMKHDFKAERILRTSIRKLRRPNPKNYSLAHKLLETRLR